jgi:NAD-dependent dihydropyrimidine dehydrogenase PreA subunit
VEIDNTTMTEIRVCRFDPEKDSGPRYETHRVPLGGFVLDALKYIYEQYDASLSFRFGCTGPTYERCGACAVEVNGESALSCKKILEQGMTVAPHRKIEVLKDLVVDFTRVNANRKAGDEGGQKIAVDPDKCTACRDCVLICPFGALEISKVDGKAQAVMTDPESCCGRTCGQCVTFCPNKAIQFKTAIEAR